MVAARNITALAITKGLNRNYPCQALSVAQNFSLSVKSARQNLAYLFGVGVHNFKSLVFQGKGFAFAGYVSGQLG